MDNSNAWDAKAWESMTWDEKHGELVKGSAAWRELNKELDSAGAPKVAGTISAPDGIEPIIELRSGHEVRPWFPIIKKYFGLLPRNNELTMVILTLGQKGLKEATPLLLSLFSEVPLPSEHDLIQAGEALYKIGDRSCHPQVLDFCKDRRLSHVWVGLIRHLVRIGTLESLLCCKAMLNDATILFKPYLIESIGKFKLAEASLIVQAYKPVNREEEKAKQKALDRAEKLRTPQSGARRD